MKHEHFLPFYWILPFLLYLDMDKAVKMYAESKWFAVLNLMLLNMHAVKWNSISEPEMA